MLSKDVIKKILLCMGFKSKDGVQDTFIKIYNNHNNFSIELDFEKEIINYSSIRRDDKTTSNFEKDENFVVLECVNRLLEKGYSPNSLVLEKKWLLGHKSKGKLDILVEDEIGKAFLMIECKTWGIEYDKELKKMISKNNQDKWHGGQLFSYYQQDKNAKYLCLYTSNFNGAIEYKNSIVEVSDKWESLNSLEEVLDHWNKNFKTNGIFEDYATAYNVQTRSLRRQDLKPLSQDDSGKIFNQFAEILRHNVVSDKPNAFNKIFNLFLCKIVDEDKNESDELDFQWLENDTDESLQMRLSDLYKTGMNNYLNKDVADYSEDALRQSLLHISDEKEKEDILKLFRELRLYKNNEFAFKEVFDEKSFKENAIVVREVVELLQPYQIRYSHKQQFLGDFFELLLTTGLKQEAGQFFTPVPIAKFIVSSLPIEEMIKSKIDKKQIDILPYVIDFAAGSGHFLTEAMDEIQNIIQNVNLVTIQTPSVAKNFKAWQDNSYQWAKEHIYGIDADYRLVKTAKVSCFLNGDGEANVIHADGLASFGSESYTGKLQMKQNNSPQDNEQFDILLANPPYSISGFKNTIKNGANNFSLFNSLTDNSSEIEALFIERMKQLLKVGGWAGIILPISILSNGGIYEKARTMILENFYIHGLAQLSSEAFMATGTNTVVLFLEKRPKEDVVKIKIGIDTFFKNYQDVTLLGVEKPFSRYVEIVFEDKSLEEYIQDIKDGKLDIEQEKKKLTTFLLTVNKETVLVRVGEKQSAKDFLGYEFSNRKGNEGLHRYEDDEGVFLTSLYNDTDFNDLQKANSYIRSMCLGKKIDDIHQSLKENVWLLKTNELIDLDRNNFGNEIILYSKKKLKIESQYKVEKLELLCDLESGVTYEKKDQVKNSNYKILTADNISITGNFLENIEKKIFIKSEPSSNKKLKKNDMFICLSSGSKQHVGKIAFINKDTDYYCGGFMGILRIKEKFNQDILPYYVYSIINQLIDFQHIATGSNINNIGSLLMEIKIPLPPLLDVQQKIVDECEAIDEKVRGAEEVVLKNTIDIESLFDNINLSNGNKYSLVDDNIFDISIGQRVLLNEVKTDGRIPVYSANVFKPFGYIDKLLIEDFSVASILWGIDGDWMVNFLYANIPFYPTDHCGVLRVKTENINPHYLAYIIKKEGRKIGFSRDYRASIDRVSNINITIPSIDIQNKIVEEIEVLEKQIAENQAIIDLANERKNAVLKKYL